MMQWSQYSLNLYDAYLHSDENITVKACPGAGKTTNIKHIWSLDDKSKVYLVFNKHNQIEAQQKLPVINGCEVMTLNSLGHRAVLNTFGKVKLDDKKVRGIIRDNVLYAKYVSTELFNRQLMLEKAIGIAKCIDTGIGLSRDVYDEMISSYDLDEYDDMYHDVNTVLSINDDITNVIDFADQLRFPVIYNAKMPSFEIVLGDEVQDFNPIQAALLVALQAQRYILVGDEHQSIYGFRGAMIDSMDYLTKTFTSREMPLSINYRCGKSIVREAAAIYPQSIEPWDKSPEGIVRYGYADAERFTSDDLILCRLNAPLITLAYVLLKRGIPCFVRGRDIAQGIVSLIKKQQCTSVKTLMDALHTSMDAELYKASLKEDEGKMQRIEDKYNSALLFCAQCSLSDTPDVVITHIEKLFAETKGTCLTTVHKAKGLEAQRCFTLETSLFDVYKAKARQTWQRVQECNIHYVAVTRAKEELVYM